MKFLIVVDMQKDFVDGALGTAEAQTIVPMVCEKIQKFDGAVIVTQDTHQENYLDTQEGSILPVVHCIKNTPGWELDSKVDDALRLRFEHEKKQNPAGVVPVCSVMKPTFGSVDLATALAAANQQEPIDEVVLVGLCTDICVVSNALLVKAFLPEVKVTVDAACCAGVTPESHAAALKTMQMCQVDVENWEG